MPRYLDHFEPSSRARERVLRECAELVPVTAPPGHHREPALDRRDAKVVVDRAVEFEALPPHALGEITSAREIGGSALDAKRRRAKRRLDGARSVEQLLDSM